MVYFLSFICCFDSSFKAILQDSNDFYLQTPDYHMKLHYSQTRLVTLVVRGEFDYHMKLHYSQTRCLYACLYGMFDYHMKLHYSQTMMKTITINDLFDYHMKWEYPKVCVNLQTDVR